MSEEIKNVEAVENEPFIEISYERGYNMSAKFGDVKKYSFKISGNQSAVEEQIKNHKTKLTKYVKEVESLIEDAHKYNIERAKAESEIEGNKTV